ncbi:MAG: InlB B-repeat-containing protein, partial [Phycisphaerae bacterium]
WNTAADGSGTSYGGGSTLIFQPGTKLYAQWTASSATYALAYSGNGSTGGAVPVDPGSPYLVGSTVTVQGNSGFLSKTGYSFVCWNTAPDGSGTNYYGANSFPIASNLILYAQWAASPTTYAMSYNGNGSTGGTAPTDGGTPYNTGGATVTVLGNTGSLVKTGYTFAGWNTAANGSGTSYNTGNTFTIAGATTLYAQWSASVLTLVYNGNGNTSGIAPTNTYATGAMATVVGNPGGLARPGYIFAGWNTAASGTGTGYLAGSTIAVNSNTTLYAQWTVSAATYSVTYNGNGSTGGAVPIDSNSSYPVGATVIVLSNSNTLTNTGYAMAGWNTAPDGSGISYSPADTFAIGANVTLYAQWSLPCPNNYPYSPYNAGGMDPQLTGWPLTQAERNFLAISYDMRRPGKEVKPTAKYLPAYWPATPAAEGSGDPNWYAQTNGEFVNVVDRYKSSQGTAVDILLIGDSITWHWLDIGASYNQSPQRFNSVWSSHFGQYKTLDVGMAGDKTQGLLWRLDHGSVEGTNAPGLNPKVVILAIGHNDMFFTGETGTAAAAQGILWCVKNVRIKFPNAHVIVSKILPTYAPGSSFYNDAQAINAALDPLISAENDPKIHVLPDMWGEMTNPDGTLIYRYFRSDEGVTSKIHLSLDGYQLWAGRLQPLVNQILN